MRRPLTAVTLLVYVTTVAISLYPIAATQIPSFGDYLNHLARMHVLWNHGQSAALQDFYDVRWRLIPYLGMDAIFGVIPPIVTIYTAGRLFLGFCVVIPIISVLAIQYAVYRRLDIVPAAACLVSYNYVLLWGFLNYLVGICLAVIIFAGWIATAHWPRWRRAITFTLPTLAVYLAHLEAFAAYGIMIGAYELTRAWHAGFRPARRIAANWGAAAVPAVPALFVAWAIRFEETPASVIPAAFGDFSDKLVTVFSPFLFLDTTIDIIGGTAFVAALYAGIRLGFLTVAHDIWPVAGTMMLVALCTPVAWLGGWGLDFRLPIVMVVILLGGTVSTDRMGNRLKAGVLTALLLCNLGRALDITGALAPLDVQIAVFRSVAESIPRGERLLIVDDATDRARGGLSRATTNSMAMTFLIDRDVFVPGIILDHTTVQPKAALRASSSNGDFPRISDLADDGRGNVGPALGYLQGWREKFSYLLLEHWGNRLENIPADLEPVVKSDVADLYRVIPLRARTWQSPGR